ncbi:GMC family oxidoreductase [Mycolicibacterium vaccae]|jgi:choline dehydrogenase|uniref:GMC family oxidoreductase n=1 Tax=Mycolicibacterium vaccae TaxID=1810 RepID=UPI0002F0A7E5|nr:GMC family oxidoreductase N-terminal domain-containing protein [Mycolicibacterium vaccae]ANI40292.1 oxidoreductase [Mycolicibacterium vaccae 95051]
MADNRGVEDPRTGGLIPEREIFGISARSADRGLAQRIRVNQAKLRSALKAQYDFIVCGSGSSGSVVARRLAEDPTVSVLLLEAGRDDDVEAVSQAHLWPLNIGSATDWNYTAEPSPNLNGRSIPMNMGKVLGGGSSINVMMWARGHKNDWDYFASEAGDEAWGYDAVLDIYRRVEDWRGAPDPERRGTGGVVYVQPAPDPHPVAPALVAAAAEVGLPTFDSQNGRIMEGGGGASLAEIRVCDGLRQSVFRSYTYPYMDRPNLTVLTHALVTRVTLKNSCAIGVEFRYRGTTHRIRAGSEVVLSLGAVQTPKVLMLSGIGDCPELSRLGITPVRHLPGVGQNMQDHPAVASVWESPEPVVPRNNAGEAVYFWKSDPALDTPDIQTCQIERAMASPEAAAQFGLPENGWTLGVGVVRPESRGSVRLTGADPTDPVRIDPNMLSAPADMAAAVAGVELSREIAYAAPLRSFVKREVMPGNLKGRELERFIRDATSTYWHQTCTAKMGRDEMSVVDGQLRVHGVDRLRIADGSIMPRITTGNTMAPCVVIGERAAELLKDAHRL